MAALGVRVRDSHLTVADMRELVRLAERQGYESVWLPESMGREAFIELTALVLAGEVYTIKHYQPDAPLPQPVPVYVAALRPQMLRLAGAVADGVLMNWATLDYIPQAIEYVRQGAEASGRRLSDVHIASYLRTCVTAAPETVEQASREQIARYCSMVYYQRYFASVGFATEAAAIAQAWQRGDRAAAVQAVTRPMLQALTIYGTAHECRQRLQAYRSAGLQLPIIAPFPIGEPIQETFARTIAGCA
jgi:alkanesulfonate monooxygenase SsuD/methylene tetrahydromethanopterin reductase-like flavin-dependent oxidoreductase (luciferase family)